MAAPSSSGASDGILYALVARGGVVLAEHSTVSGNSSVVAVGLLQKVPLQEGFRASWAAGQHIFHILSAGGLTYLCMAGQVGGRTAEDTALAPHTLACWKLLRGRRPSLIPGIKLPSPRAALAGPRQAPALCLFGGPGAAVCGPLRGGGRGGGGI